jgi:hypothetical protein
MKTVYNLVSTSLLAILGLNFSTQPVFAQEQSTADIRERVKQRAREVTVEFVIEDTAVKKKGEGAGISDHPIEGEGSGILVFQEKNTYYVLTARHVIERLYDAENLDDINLMFNGYISISQGPNKNKYNIDGICLPGRTEEIESQENIKNICMEQQDSLENQEKFDLALVSFSCSNNECRDYRPVEIGNTSPGRLKEISEETVFLSGFPNESPTSQNNRPTDNSEWKFVELQFNQEQRRFCRDPKYVDPDLAYSDINTSGRGIRGGFSGGAILDRNEQLIGLHTLQIPRKRNLFCGYSINTILESFPQVQAEVPYSPPPENPNPVPAPSETEESAPPALW